MVKTKILFRDLYIPYLLREENFPVGGAAIETFAWIKGLLKNNCRVGILTWEGAKALVGDKCDFDIVEAFDSNKGLRKIRWLSYRLPRLFVKIKEYKPDYLIQECASIETFFLSMICKILKVKFVYRIGSDIEVDNRIGIRLNKIEKFFFKLGLNSADTILCQNNYQFTSIKMNYPSKNNLLIYNPFYLNSKPSKILKKEERGYIAWIGNFRYQKNLPSLYKISSECSNVNFKVAGLELDSIDKNSKIALENLRKLDNVEFVGYLNGKSVIEFLSRAIALLNTSHIEGFSNTFLEAFSVGTPVIACHRVDPDDIIKKNNLGIVKNTDEEIVAMIKNCCLEEDYSELSKRCLKYVEQNHDSNILANNLLEHLRNS